MTTLGANEEPRAWQAAAISFLCGEGYGTRREVRANADVAKSVDAADFNWSARGETRGAEPLKIGES